MKKVISGQKPVRKSSGHRMGEEYLDTVISELTKYFEVCYSHGAITSSHPKNTFGAYSEVYILVLGIYYKLQTFIYLPANGIVQGMRPLIGYNYGAWEHQRVSQIFKIVLCMSGIIMLFGTVICLLIPGQLMGLFTHTKATIQAGETALRIIGAGFIVSAVSVTSSGALEGLGKGTPSLLISLCRYVVVIIPAAFLLSRFFGAVGVWNAFWITEVISAVISLIIYRKSIAKPVTTAR